MVKVLNKEIGADVFIAANAHRMQMDFVTNPGAFGMHTNVGFYQFLF
jgi:hypothetical protein